MTKYHFLDRKLASAELATRRSQVRLTKGRTSQRVPRSFSTTDLSLPLNSINKIKMIDLFAGTGGFSLAFNKYGIKTLFANDFCINSQKIFDANHNTNLTTQGAVENLLLKERSGLHPRSVFAYGDLNDIENNNIPNHNILCGGFPCQPFSIAGKQQGFKDQRSNVF